MFHPVAKYKVRWLRIKSERKIELGKLVCKLSIFSLGVLNKDTDSVGDKMVSTDLTGEKKKHCRISLTDLSQLLFIFKYVHIIVTNMIGN